MLLHEEKNCPYALHVYAEYYVIITYLEGKKQNKIHTIEKKTKIYHNVFPTNLNQQLYVGWDAARKY